MEKHFKSHEAYRKWVAYGNIHKEFKHHAPYPTIYINGKLHSVKHKK